MQRERDSEMVLPSKSTQPPAEKASATSSGQLRLTRNVKDRVQCMLWGRAAGRCEFWGCNKPLWKSSVTQEEVNVGQKAHIWAFSEGGPRYNPILPDEEINSPSNLILVCYDCHRKIDKEKDGGRYPAELLKRWKLDHENRVERVTGISPKASSDIILYGANIGEHSSTLRYESSAAALFPDRYPSHDKPVELSLINSPFVDRDSAFWKMEAENLRRQFDNKVRQRISLGEIGHLSVFALAPQPLLILLGTLLGDILPADVYQLHREPPGWRWPKDGGGQALEVRKPSSLDGQPVLVLGLSATIAPDRIREVVGDKASIWIVTVENPHNDMMKSREQLGDLRRYLRSLLDEIKAEHGQSSTLHIFPAIPIAAALELGRIRMPKADLPWIIYDQNNDLGGFTQTLTIPVGGNQNEL